MQNDVRELNLNYEIWNGRTKKPKKKIAYKHINSYYPKEWYQADTVYLSDYLVSDKRFWLTMINHFSKYGWIVVLSGKSATIVLRAIKACIETHGQPESLQTTMVQNLLMKNWRCIWVKIKSIISVVLHTILKVKEQ